MALQIIERDTPFGQVAQNFGRGLGETFSSEVGKQRKAAAFRGLTEGEEPLTLSQMYSQLLNTGAFELDEIQKLEPFMVNLAQQQARRGNTEPPAGGLNVPEGQPLTSVQAPKGDTPQDFAPPVEKYPVSLVDPQYQESLTQEPIIVNTQTIRQRMNELERQQPGRFIRESDLEAAARESLESERTKLSDERAIATTQQNRTDELRNKFDDSVQKKIQAGGLGEAWAKLPQVAQDRLFSDAVRAVREGASLDNAANAAAKKALDVTKSLGQFYNRGGLGLLGVPSEQFRQDMASYRKSFADLDMLDEYASELQAKGFGEHLSSAMAYPVSEGVMKEIGRLQPEAKKEASIWKKLVLSPFGPVGLFTKPAEIAINEWRKDQPRAPERSQQFAERLAEVITPEDSIDAIALAADDAGLESRVIYDYFRQLTAQGQYQPSPRQEREISQALPVKPSLQDMVTALTQGAGEQGKFGFIDSIRRRWFGKS